MDYSRSRFFVLWDRMNLFDAFSFNSNWSTASESGRPCKGWPFKFPTDIEFLTPVSDGTCDEQRRTFD